MGPRTLEPRGSVWRCYLTIGESPEHWFLPIDEGSTFFIGRGRDADLAIEDPRASRQHCRITLHQGTYYLEDLRSVRGTLRNNRPVRSKAKLAPGDIITIAAARLHFHCLADEVRDLCQELNAEREQAVVENQASGGPNHDLKASPRARTFPSTPLAVAGLAAICIAWMSHVVWAA